LIKKNFEQLYQKIYLQQCNSCFSIISYFTISIKIKGNRMKKLYPLLLLFFVIQLPIHCMKRETGEPEEQPRKRPKTEEQEERATFELLPKDVKRIILGFLLHASGSTKTAKLYTAADNIRNFMLVNKEMVSIIDDPRVTGYLIHELANRYANGDTLLAVLALRTAGTGTWLLAQQANDQKLKSRLVGNLFNLLGNGLVAEASFLLKYFPPEFINSIDTRKRTFLFFAANLGDKKLVQQILAFPNSALSINNQTENGATALMVASEKGFTDIVELLLARPNIQINLQNNIEWTALMTAVVNQHTAIVERLLARPDINVNLQNQKHWNSLIIAAKDGYTAIVEQLLSNPSLDLNAQNFEGLTALSWASQKGHSAIVELLLAKPNINVNLADKKGVTPLHFAADHGNTAIVELLLNHPDIDVNKAAQNGWTPLLSAIHHGNIAIVERLLKSKNIDFNMQTQVGTALLVAVRKGNLTIVERLLKMPNINTNLKDSRGFTALDTARQLRSPNKDAIIKLLEAKYVSEALAQ
jgi:ankyrin repeat protein